MDELQSDGEKVCSLDRIIYSCVLATSYMSVFLASYGALPPNTVSTSKQHMADTRLYDW